jgi:probable phosphoglycerate mutase
MSESLPQIYLVRHGQTAWSLSGQHTGRSDIPLTPAGEEQARRMGHRLAGESFSRVFCSPTQRARRTCELSGFAAAAEIDPDLAEWDYGDYEGLLSAEIHARQPNWLVFRDGSPHGESVADATARADRVVARLRAVNDRVAVFSSGHFLRVLAARWLGVETAFGQFLFLGTGSLSILGYEHTLGNPAIMLWNEVPK